MRFTTNAKWSITPHGKLNLPKIGPVRVRWSRAPPSVPSTVTVIKDAGGRYWAGFVVARERILHVRVGEVANATPPISSTARTIPTMRLTDAACSRKPTFRVELSGRQVKCVSQ
ncbi:hypothetical protein [Streptomyces sp. NBC_01320]|uniref:hypothetical protein n=1 Tax=Streptomyces sp. NBC_01320 TaxID=2903824 RepID=UPI002E14EBCF